MKDLKQITVIGLGLLGGSICLAIRRYLPNVKLVGHSHRPSTRRKARRIFVADRVVDDLCESVATADIVLLATPIFTFEQIFAEISEALPLGCIVTDVGSTKVLAHRWARSKLPKTAHYVGSHPVAGSEQRGVEFARGDLFEQSCCIITTTGTTDRRAVRTLKSFWSRLGCSVRLMTPAEHDRIFANVSHVPHAVAVSLVNAGNAQELKLAGKGFTDTSRIASGPANIWTDVLLSNARNTSRGINRVISELSKLKGAIDSKDRDGIHKLLVSARQKRAILVNYKDRGKESIS